MPPAVCHSGVYACWERLGVLMPVAGLSTLFGQGFVNVSVTMPIDTAMIHSQGHDYN
jgi:hypothetical protein